MKPWREVWSYSENTVNTCLNGILSKFEHAAICRTLEADEAYMEEVRGQLKDQEQGAWCSCPPSK